MDIDKKMVCPVCKGTNFTAKYEATYVYSYKIDSNAPGEKNDDEFLPFLFDYRELKNAEEYVECAKCGARYPCSFSKHRGGIDFTILQKAIRSDYVENPGYLG